MHSNEKIFEGYCELMNVCLVDSLPESGQGVYIDYFNRACSHNGWRRIDLEHRLFLRQEDFFLSIEKWHTELCIRGADHFKWWWLMSASRLILWHPPIWKPLVFALAAAEEMESITDNKVYVVGCPGEVAEYLSEFCSGKRVLDERKTLRVSQDILRNFLVSFKHLIDIIIHIVFCPNRTQNIEGVSPIIIWTYLLSPGAECGCVKDHFFGDMFKPDAFKYPVHWLCHGSLRKNSRVCSSVYSKGDRSFIYDWLGISEWWSLVKFFFSEWWFHRKPFPMPEFVFNGYVSSGFARNFASAMINRSVPVAEFAIFLGIKNMLQKISPRALVYPYEEKGVERALLMAVQESKKATKAIGFAHAVYSKGHMFLRRRSQVGANPPMPDKLLVTGLALKKWLGDWAGWDDERVLVAGSPRWHSMIKREPEGGLSGRPLRILILIGTGYEATELSNQMEVTPEAFGESEVVIRPYPYAWDVEQEKAFARIKRIDQQIQVSGGTLDLQISWCDVAVYCSTSAGLETMLSGRLTVYLDLNHVFTLNAIDDKIKSEYLFGCRNLSELNMLLCDINKMTKEQYSDIAHRQCCLASNIFKEIDYVALNDLLMLTDTETFISTP